jgi:uncharacterized membrane protein
MAQRTITRMYDNFDDARAVVADLEQAGIPHGDISLVANSDAHGRYAGTSPETKTTSSAAGTGAVAGSVLGGGAGLLAGIGALAIPGVGPVVAAGWLIATLAGAGVGAASGGLVGSLTGAGVSRDEAHVYSEGVKRGGSLVTVRADESEAARVEAIFARHKTTDWQERRASYGSDWEGLNATSTVDPAVAPGSMPLGVPPVEGAPVVPPKGRV